MLLKIFHAISKMPKLTVASNVSRARVSKSVKQGETVTVKVEGDDEEAAAAAIQKFLTENV